MFSNPFKTYFKDLKKHVSIIYDLDIKVVEREFPKIIKKLKGKNLEAQSFFFFVIQIYLNATGLNKFVGEQNFSDQLANLIHERFHRTWGVTNKEAYNIWYECCIIHNKENLINEEYLSGKKKAYEYEKTITNIVFFDNN